MKPTLSISQCVRDILTEDKSTSCVDAAMMANHRLNTEVNFKSFTVTFYTIRKSMGIGKQRQSAHQRSHLANARVIGITATPRPSKTTPIVNLLSAARFVREIGSIEAALDSVRQVAQLQIAAS